MFNIFIEIPSIFRIYQYISYYENYLSVTNDGENANEEGGKKSHQKRGGKSLQKPKKEKVPSKIIISKDKRRGNKYVTIISGLATNDIDLEVARKFFAQRFACACSKYDKDDELIIQGDVVEKLFDTILEKFPQVCVFNFRISKI